MSDPRPTVLVLSGYFRKGFQTGPTQSVRGMAAQLSDRFRFRVIAEAAEDEVPGVWGKAFGIDRLPLAKGAFGPKGLRGAVNTADHDILMAVSFFDPGFSILPLALRRAGLLRRTPTLVAPRGEFSPGALAAGAAKKRSYIKAARALGLLRGAALQATSEAEAAEIRATLPGAGPVYVTPNIRSLPPLPAHEPAVPGAPLRIAFLSRIDRKKNLLFALDALDEAGVPAVFNIFGPVFHEDYWAACRARIETIGPPVVVVHHGAVDQEQVIEVLAGQDLFFLPTLGENFGHAIADALLAGTPALLSDRTPWRNLQAAGAGWDLPLSDRAPFIAALRDFASLPAPGRLAMRARARGYAERFLDPAGAAASLAACFDDLLAGSGR